MDMDMDVFLVRFARSEPIAFVPVRCSSFIVKADGALLMVTHAHAPPLPPLARAAAFIRSNRSAAHAQSQAVPSPSPRRP